MNCAVAVTYRYEASHFNCRISQIGTKCVIMMCSCHCPCLVFTLCVSERHQSN